MASLGFYEHKRPVGKRKVTTLLMIYNQSSTGIKSLDLGQPPLLCGGVWVTRYDMITLAYPFSPLPVLSRHLNSTSSLILPKVLSSKTY